MAGWAGGSDKVKVCCWWRVEAEALTATVSAPHMNRHTRLQLSMEAACHASRAPDLPQLRSLRRPAGSRRPRPRTRVPRTATPTTVALRSQWSPTNQTAMLAPRPHPSRLSQARRSDRGPPVPARPVPPPPRSPPTAASRHRNDRTTAAPPTQTTLLRPPAPLQSPPRSPLSRSPARPAGPHANPDGGGGSGGDGDGGEGNSGGGGIHARRSLHERGSHRRRPR